VIPIHLNFLSYFFPPTQVKEILQEEEDLSEIVQLVGKVCNYTFSHICVFYFIVPHLYFTDGQVAGLPYLLLLFLVLRMRRLFEGGGALYKIFYLLAITRNISNNI
jgi:hypothetical protein